MKADFIRQKIFHVITRNVDRIIIFIIFLCQEVENSTENSTNQMLFMFCDVHYYLHRS